MGAAVREAREKAWDEAVTDTFDGRFPSEGITLLGTTEPA